MMLAKMQWLVHIEALLNATLIFPIHKSDTVTNIISYLLAKKFIKFVSILCGH